MSDHKPITRVRIDNKKRNVKQNVADILDRDNTDDFDITNNGNVPHDTSMTSLDEQQESLDASNIGEHKKHHTKAIAIIMAFVLIVFGAFVITRLLKEEPVNIDEDSSYDITIYDGEKTSDIASELKEARMIRTVSSFEEEYKDDGEPSFESGAYRIEGGMTVNDIIGKFSNGDTGVSVLISSGDTIHDIADEISDTLGTIDSEDLENEFRNPHGFDSSEHWLVEQIPEDGTLEGCLLPGGYTVELNMNAHDITGMLLSACEEELDSLQLPTARNNLNAYQVLTMASMINGDTSGGVDDENVLRDMSSVLHNRLENNVNLNSVSTEAYAAGKTVEDALTDSDASNGSPYNTVNQFSRGLPPSPICAPSAMAIEATCYPNQTSHMWYLCDIENGEVSFYDQKTDYDNAVLQYRASMNENVE